MAHWLKCIVRNGMFSDERTIVVRIRDNQPLERFVPEAVVWGTGENAKVKVRVVRRSDGQWAELPTPYRETVPVDESQLEPA